MKKRILSIILGWIFFQTALPAQVIAPENRIIRQDILNSPELESNIALTADRLTMYFSSKRGGSWWSQNDADIFYSFRLDTSAPWAQPLALQPPVNDELDQDEVYISPDGHTLSYQHWSHDWATEGGPYFEMEQISSTDWANPKALGDAITDFFSTTGFRATDGMARLPDGSVIFAAGPEFDRSMDLYYAISLGNGKWQRPVPLDCNTEADERSVFIAGDGKTLYFASNRPGSRGGLDVYKAQLRDDGTVSEPENIGAPVNTDRNESGFVIHNEREAYFVRDGDIYRVENPALKIVPYKPVSGPEPQANATPPAPPDTPPATLPSTPPATIPVEPAKKAIPSVVSVPVPELKVEPITGLQFEKTNNVVFLLDISASMDALDKLPLMVGSIRRIAPSLRSIDQVSIVSFASEPFLILNGVAGDQTQFIDHSLNGLKAGGTTEGKPALQMAYRCANAHFIENGNNVVVLASDGNMNLSNLKQMVTTAAKKGIYLVVFLYGSPAPEVEKGLRELTEAGKGWQSVVTSGNIDSSLQRALLAKLR